MNYIVKSGDTLSKISQTFFSDTNHVQAIAAANNISDPNNIHVGQKLSIPVENMSTEPDASALVSDIELGTSEQHSDLIRIEQLQDFLPRTSIDILQRYCAPLNQMTRRYNIDTSLRLAHFLAQIAHESGGLRYVSENLNYSAKALRAVFGKYFPTDEHAEACARQPEKIANIVYANRMGNGNTESGDGWNYRGRGLIQITGKDNYSALSGFLDVDLLHSPDLLADDPSLAVASACWYWQNRKLNQYADQDDIHKITKLINGGYNGLEDRTELLVRAKQIFTK